MPMTTEGGVAVLLLLLLPLLHARAAPQPLHQNSDPGAMHKDQGGNGAAGVHQKTKSNEILYIQLDF